MDKNWVIKILLDCGLFYQNEKVRDLFQEKKRKNESKRFISKLKSKVWCWKPHGLYI